MINLSLLKLKRVYILALLLIPGPLHPPFPTRPGSKFFVNWPWYFPIIHFNHSNVVQSKYPCYDCFIFPYNLRRNNKLLITFFYIWKSIFCSHPHKQLSLIISFPTFVSILFVCVRVDDVVSNIFTPLGLLSNKQRQC